MRCVNTLSVVLWLVNLQNVTEKRKTAEEEEEEEEEEVKKKNLKNCKRLFRYKLSPASGREKGKKEKAFCGCVPVVLATTELACAKLSSHDCFTGVSNLTVRQMW